MTLIASRRVFLSNWLITNNIFDIIFSTWNAEIAQLVEHLSEEQRVPSSSLGLGICESSSVG